MTHGFDVLIVGSGPAGIAAAVRAAERGRDVAIVDENFQPGGQIWRGSSVGIAQQWIERLNRASVQRFFGWHIFDARADGVLHASRDSSAAEFRFRSLIVATGARERFLPFPGWTLPNVLGAGALQVLVKSGLPIEGKRVVVAGTGPLLVAVTAYMQQHGADVVALCEQASLNKLARFGIGMASQPAKLVDAVRYLWQARGVQVRTSCWPTAAVGTEMLEGVVLSDRGKRVELKADFLACGFHLVPNYELAMLLGCALDGSYVRVDEFQQTSVPDVFSAGETTGIGGVAAALVEGEIAGLAAAGAGEEATSLFPRRDATRKFTRLLDRTFALNPALRKLAAPETILCRCEDVTMASMHGHGSWRAAKLQSRVGMGACQGRVCGAACEFLFGWGMESVRPPIQPTSVGSLIRANVGDL
jgi:D-hydroxyproline dehydrogenase subunit alpha